MYMTITLPLLAETQDPNTIVATVNSVNVIYKDVKVEPEMIRQLSTINTNHIELEKATLAFEKERLASKIHDLIFEQIITDWGLSVSESEIDGRVEQLFERANMTTEKANIICQTGQALFDALTAWQQNPSKEDSIFNTMLANTSISREQWNMFQAFYNTPEKLKTFVVPNNINEMKQTSRESSKKDLLCEKLENIITQDVTATINEIETSYEQQYGNAFPKPSFEDAKEVIKCDLLAKKKQEAIISWWQKQYNDADIQTESRFIGVKNILYQSIPVFTVRPRVCSCCEK
jgi:hypothetical protein